MIISGGFNIYPERSRGRAAGKARGAGGGGRRRSLGALGRDAGRLRGASRRAPRPTPRRLRAAVNERLGKTQRLAALRFVEALPRSAIGKVLKRELRATFGALP